MNKLRSPTGEFVAQQLGFESDSAGLSPDANMVLEPDQIKWADVIFVMESTHKKKLSKKYSKYLSDKRVIVLGIPDDYEYMQPELIEIFNKKLPQFLDMPRTKKPKM
jgi:predicted protein tyrosine phosphatase